MTDLQERKLALVSLAEYLQVEITEGQLLAYIDDLSSLTTEELNTALKSLRLSGDNFYGRFPLPSAIKNYISGSRSDRALDISLKIIQSISKFGWPNPKEAREFIGEQGWSVVESYGGWTSICLMIDEPEKIGIFQTQFQKAASMILEKSRLSDNNVLISKQSRGEIGGKERSEPIAIGCIVDGFCKENRNP